MHTISPSLPAADDIAAPQIVLRDGSVVTVRPSTMDDLPAVRRFFHDLSAESRYRRFFTAGEAPDDVIKRLTDSHDPARNLTLVAQRSIGGETRIIAAASYTAISADT